MGIQHRLFGTQARANTVELIRLMAFLTGYCAYFNLVLPYLNRVWWFHFIPLLFTPVIILYGLYAFLLTTPPKERVYPERWAKTTDEKYPDMHPFDRVKST